MSTQKGSTATEIRGRGWLAAPPMLYLRSVRIEWVAIAVLCGVVYSGSLNGSFHYDDFHSVRDNYHIRDPGNILRFFIDPAMFSVDADKGMYRPLLLITYALNFAMGQFSVQGYHVTNIGIHAANSCLVWWLAGALGIGRKAALLAGALFAVHPVCSEPVNYISSRSESLAALFYLAALALYVRGAGEGRWPGGACLLLALGLLTKSTLITLPGVFLLYDMLILNDGVVARVRARLWRRHLPALAVCAVYLGVITANGFFVRSVGNSVRSLPVQLLTQTKALGYYVQLLATPVRLSVEPQFRIAESWQSLHFLAPAVLVGSGCALAWGLWRRRLHRPLFYLLAAPLTLAPVLLFPLNVLVNERRAYLACAFLCLGLGHLLQASIRRRSMRVGVGLFVIAFAALSYQRSAAWSTELALWSDAAAKSPLMPRTHLYLGNAHQNAALFADEGQAMPHWNSAIASYARVVDLGTDFELAVRALNNTGVVYFYLEDYPAAESAFRQALAVKDDYPDALANIGNVLLYDSRDRPDPESRRRRLEEALSYYERALELGPGNFQIHGNIGVVYRDLGRLDRALLYYSRALELNPQDYNTLTNMGSTLLLLARRVGGDQRASEALVREAAEYYGRALEIKPNDVDAQAGLQRARLRARAD